MRSPSSDAVGQLIDDRYKLLRLIGEGGMGRVYEAEHVGISKQVAVKILHPTFTHQSEVVARFRQEARIASQIGNAHIVDVTDSGMTEDGHFFFVMEYLEGVELHSTIQGGALEPGRALHITRQIADALGAAHDQGVIHRDLKPENILLVERDGDPDFVKVLDFGIAKTIDAERSERKLTQPGLAIGTPEYVAPEQALALTADARSDVYALGAILYELVTGALPYQAETFTQVLVLKSTTEPPPPRALRDDLAVEVEEIILKAMAREPEHRFQTMAEMSDAITAIIGGRDPSTSRVVPLPVPPPAPEAPATAAPIVPDVPRAPDESILIHYEELEGEPGEVAPSSPPVEVTPAAVEEAEPRPAPRRVTGRTWFLLVLLAIVGGGAYWYLYTWLPAEEEAARSQQPVPQARRPVVVPAVASVDAGAAAAPAPVAPDAGPTLPAAALDAAPPPPPDAGPAPGATTSPPTPPPRAARTIKEARAFIARAARAAARKQWDLSRALFDRVARSQHLSELGYLGLARVELATGHLDLAIEHATASVRDGGDAAARHVLARALVAADRKMEAIKQYQLLLKDQPTNPVYQRELEALRAPARKPAPR